MVLPVDYNNFMRIRRSHLLSLYYGMLSLGGGLLSLNAFSLLLCDGGSCGMVECDQLILWHDYVKCYNGNYCFCIVRLYCFNGACGGGEVDIVCCNERGFPLCFENILECDML